MVDQNVYELVIQNGRIINPASQTDAILNIGIQADTIAAIGAKKLQVDAAKIQDHGTYENPYQASSGIEPIFIGGQQVIENGVVLDSVFVGQYLSLLPLK